MIELDLEDDRFGEERGVVNVDESVGSRITSLLVGGGGGGGHGKLLTVIMRGCDTVHAR
jgi:hypothetical protein